MRNNQPLTFPLSTLVPMSNSDCVLLHHPLNLSRLAGGLVVSSQEELGTSQLLVPHSIRSVTTWEAVKNGQGEPGWAPCTSQEQQEHCSGHCDMSLTPRGLSCPRPSFLLPSLPVEATPTAVTCPLAQLLGEAWAAAAEVSHHQVPIWPIFLDRRLGCGRAGGGARSTLWNPERMEEAKEGRPASWGGRFANGH